MNKRFVKTKDEETANKLKNIGYKELQSPENGVRIFVNDKHLVFEGIDSSKIYYSNILCV